MNFINSHQYFQVYEQTFGKFASDFKLTRGYANQLLNNWPMVYKKQTRPLESDLWLEFECFSTMRNTRVHNTDQ